MKNQALFSSKDKSKKIKCRLLQFLCGALRVKSNKRLTLLTYGLFMTRNVHILFFPLGKLLACDSKWFTLHDGIFFQEGQLSVTGESMCTKYWLTA